MYLDIPPAIMRNALAIFFIVFFFFILKLQINNIHSKDHLLNVSINFGNSYKRRGTIIFIWKFQETKNRKTSRNSTMNCISKHKYFYQSRNILIKRYRTSKYKLRQKRYTNEYFRNNCLQSPIHMHLIGIIFQHYLKIYII